MARVSMTTPAPRVLEINELAINWHLTESCNYRCGYCFASWNRTDTAPELWKDRNGAARLLSDLWAFFRPGNANNPLWNRLRWRAVRLSLAGGEPTLLGERLVELAGSARSLGFRVSLITNGSRLAGSSLDRLVPLLDMLGVSVDSLSPSTNTAIGRVGGTGSPLAAADVVALVERARSINSRLVIKLNTVVNAQNADEDLSALVHSVAPRRWKVLRALPVHSGRLAVEDQAFAGFVERHRAFSTIVSIEDNAAMTTSYVMMDPQGRFFQNGIGIGYAYSDPVTAIGVGAAFVQLPFSLERYAARYGVRSAERQL